MRVLVVNAGSTSLKRHLVVDGREAEAVDGFVAADAVGHRVVHGGDLRGPAIVDDAVEAAIRGAVDIAPLHNTPALRGLDEARAALPGVPHVAVFDTAFHATIPPVAATYAVPPEWGVRRYGFHGISVAWAASQVAAERLVVCHLGGGCSVTAVRDGHSVDTTMGYTPLDGVPMATRAGAVDPGALLHLLRSGRLTLEELDEALERHSGLRALAGTGDVRELEARDDERARAALDVLAYRVAAAVGAMAVALGGVDAMAFTGGIGEHSARVRDAITARLGFLGAVEVAVVPAREDLVIAREVQRVLGR